ncbi:hypothetical protein KP509_39G021200 [Ceratopteris richardii]|uniref:BAH domain-containing protein n=1 Tax=Ceratopteris richardii TaxID=49495 RepID=A0A8T2PZT8_CERRI|nr:hypothetical protein KP509_39G021200 [Ceratopteris richardii]
MDNNPSSTEITWGKAKASSNKEKKFYTSFFWDNEEFFLYDNVIVYDDKVPDGHVAKIMKLWEDISSGTMMALLRWFLKPLELPSHLHSQVSIENSKELFLAFGKGKGVSNENRLDCIERKCKVLCTSTDSRNKPPSKDELEAADYFYNRIYNVDLRKLSNLGGIVKILGEHVLFNKPEWISTGQPLKCKQNPGSGSTMSQQPVEGDILSLSDSTTKGLRGMQGQSVCLKRSFKDDNFSVKRANIAESDDKLTESQPMLQATLSKDTVHLSSGPSGIVQDALERSSPSGQPLTRSASTKENEQEFSKASEAYIMNENSLGQPGPALATLALSKQIHRQDSIQHPKIQSSDLIESLSNGRVLLIQNVDPSITLKDMNDLMKSTLDGCSDVRMLQQTGSLFTQAVVICINRRSTFGV